MSDLMLNPVSGNIVSPNYRCNYNQLPVNQNIPSFGNQNDSFTSSTNQQSSAKPKKSFYEKYKSAIWGFGGAALAEIATQVLFHKSLDKLYKKSPVKGNL